MSLYATVELERSVHMLADFANQQVCGVDGEDMVLISMIIER